MFSAYPNQTIAKSQCIDLFNFKPRKLSNKSILFKNRSKSFWDIQKEGYSTDSNGLTKRLSRIYGFDDFEQLN